MKRRLPISVVPSSARPVAAPKPLAVAVASIIAAAQLAAPVRAELPVPADVLVAPGRGSVLPPSIDGNTMTIKQLSPTATLDWKSFNIGEENTVRFDQPSKTAIALNNIHQADASRIMGKLTANGQVYLVNQNGFVFGRNSQINANALVATTLGISQDVFDRGITKVFSGTGLKAALEGKGEVIVKDAAGRPVLDQSGQPVKIQILIEPGASIKSDSGGRVIVAAPVVTNQGSIETPDGQAILVAAKDKVYLQESTDANVRGLLVEVGTGGKVENLGKVIAERGNVSLLGFAVNQSGLVSATTSVRINGSVRLLAREGAQDPSATAGRLLPKFTARREDGGDGLGTKATVRLGAGSVTGVELDADKKATAIDAQPQSHSSVEVAGHDVVLGSGSLIQAKSGKVAITAADDPSLPLLKGDARVYLETGAKVDVSGVQSVALPMSRNVIKVELRNNELRDSPLQRKGLLHGKTVAVDLRDVQLKYAADGSLTSARIPIADVKGAVDRIARNIDERSTAGGSVALKSSGDVVARPGSLIDFSGGSVRYAGGVIDTTKLFADGEIVDIAVADPNRRYESILGEFSKTSAKWGITERWLIPGMNIGRFEAGYVEGKSAGELIVAAYEALLDGVLDGRTIDGLYQRTPQQRDDGGSVSIDLTRNAVVSKQDAIFAGATSAAAVGATDPIPRRESDSNEPVALLLDPNQIRQSGIRHLALTTNGVVHLGAAETLRLPDGGSLTLKSGGLMQAGAIVAAGGAVAVKPISVGGSAVLPNFVSLAETARIDVRGRWTNDAADRQALGLVTIDGGHVNLETEQGDLTLAAGSRIDVSGGGWVRGNGELRAGAAGGITLQAATVTVGKPVAALKLAGELAGWGINEGGSLALETNGVFIGPADRYVPRPEAPVAALLLTPEFFQSGGFSRYSLSANRDGLTVADGVRLVPRQRNLNLNVSPTAIASGADLRRYTQPVTLPDYQRGAADLTLNVAGLQAQDRSAVLRVGAGSTIALDIGGALALHSDTSIFVDGSVSAPGGSIALTIDTPKSADTGYFAEQGIWLGAGSSLSAPGAFRRQTHQLGLITGDVLAGGSITLQANRGSIVTRAGSVLAAPGATAVLDFLNGGAAGRTQAITRQTVSSNGGEIRLTAAEGIVADGSIVAPAGGAGAAGGTLAVTLNGGLRIKPEEPIDGGRFPDDINPLQAREIIIAADPAARLRSEQAQGGALSAADFGGRVFLSAPTLNAAGLGTIELKTDAVNARGDYVGAIRFDGAVTLAAGRQITLDSPTLATNGGQVALSAAYLALGSTQSRLDPQSGSSGSVRLAPDAVAGTGAFLATAEAIDLTGGLAFDGFGKLGLTARTDLRLNGVRGGQNKNFLGELHAASDLTLTAAQIYPSTLSDYTIRLDGAENATITIASNGNVAAPVYSAGGSLTIAAPNIVQGGVVKVPFGSLRLNANQRLELLAGSLTSVSGDGLTVPFGRAAGGLNWLYPMDASASLNRIFDTPPEKRIALSGRDLVLGTGATVDLRGGGDLYAFEFITGPGGSFDVLDPTAAGYTEKYAVLPGVQSFLAPYDPIETPLSGLRPGDSVYLSARSGLPAGAYTLLPARYALLPGAWLISPEAGTADMAPGTSFRTLAGTTVVAGRHQVSGTGVADARWQGFAVEPGSIARTRSQYQDYSANAFFAKAAAANGTTPPQLPNDAGNLSLAANRSLDLKASLTAAAAGTGVGGTVDIAADHLAIRSALPTAGNEEAGTVYLLADDLNRLNVPSLLLGGVREKERAGQRLLVSARTVELGEGTELRGSELLLAATDEVHLAAGAGLISTGKLTRAATPLLVSNVDAGSDGALVRVSAAGQGNVVRDQAVTGNTGILTVDSGARVAAAGSALLDSTRDTRFDGKIEMDGGSLVLKSSQISLGAVPADQGGLVLTDARFNLDELQLISRSDLNLFGSVEIHAQRLLLDSAAINGYGDGTANAAIVADRIEWTNTQATRGATGDGQGHLAVDAGQIVFNSGSYAIDGFSAVRLTARESIRAVGQTIDAATGNSGLVNPAALSIGADTTLAAGYIGGTSGATMTLSAAGHSLQLDRLPTDDANGASVGLGVSWSLEADAIAGNGRFALPSGLLALHATKGDVQLADRTLIDLGGRTVVFDKLTETTPAGSLSLVSDRGSVILGSGAEVALNGPGDAGQLTVSAPSGVFTWAGTVRAQSTAANGRQGRFSLDAAGFDDAGFSGLNGTLRTAGFSDEVLLRLRTGDVTIAASDDVLAHRFRLSVDAGMVDIEGRIDARGADGGEVVIQASDGITLGATARIDAGATAPGGAGGSVTLDTVRLTIPTADAGTWTSGAAYGAYGSNDPAVPGTVIELAGGRRAIVIQGGIAGSSQPLFNSERLDAWQGGRNLSTADAANPGDYLLLPDGTRAVVVKSGTTGSSLPSFNSNPVDAWKAGTTFAAFSLGEKPSAGDYLVLPNGSRALVTTGGISGSSLPAFNSNAVSWSAGRAVDTFVPGTRAGDYVVLAGGLRAVVTTAGRTATTAVGKPAFHTRAVTWQRNTAYRDYSATNPGDYIALPGGLRAVVARVTGAGNSGGTAPVFTGKAVGTTVADGQVTWRIESGLNNIADGTVRWKIDPTERVQSGVITLTDGSVGWKIDTVNKVQNGLVKIADGSVVWQLDRSGSVSDGVLAVKDGGVVWRVSTPTDWAAATPVKAGEFIRLDDGRTIVAANAGVSGAAAPTAEAFLHAGSYVDGSVVWKLESDSGLLDLSAPGSVIDVAAGEGGAAGSVHLRTGRVGADAAAITPIATRIVGPIPGKALVEATRIYAGQAAITADRIKTWQQQTAAFMGALKPLEDASGAGLQWVAGLEIRSAGDLRLADRWDFAQRTWVIDESEAGGHWSPDWRYADASGQSTLPGFLTLRAGGDLKIDAALTDAFATTELRGEDAIFRFPDLLQPGLSWSYRLIAGRDLNLGARFGSTEAPEQVVVRTGTGAIALEAGRDIRFAAPAGDAKLAAAVYTAGRPAEYTVGDLLQGRVPGVPARLDGESTEAYLQRLDPAQLNRLLRFGYLNVARDGTMFLADYPFDGGAVSLAAGRDIQGANTGQLMTDWLVRSGDWSGENPTPTAWGINVSGNFRSSDATETPEGNLLFGKGIRRFNQNVGALAGGTVDIRAGGDIRELSAMLPTTGKAFGSFNDAGRWLSSSIQVNGGGRLAVAAGGDIAGGEYFVGKGSAGVSAGGSIRGSGELTGPILELADTDFSVRARRDVTAATVLNPTLLKQQERPDENVAPENSQSYFFTYTPNSRVALRATAGNVVVDNDVDGVKRTKGLASEANSGFELAVYPGTVTLAADSGDVRINRSFSLYPTADGQLRVLARRNVGTDVRNDTRVNINVSDADPALLPSIAAPVQVLYGDAKGQSFLTQERFDPFLFDARQIHATTPVHAGSSSRSLVVAQTGDIAFPTTTRVSWFLPNAADFIAGRDIRNLSLLGQNLAASDVTRLKAGRDIQYDFLQDSNGAVLAVDKTVELGGPGQLQLSAGRNLNLGSSNGVVTVGNLRNRALSGDGGADIDAIAGLSSTIDYAGFVRKYAADPAYAKGLAGLIGLSGDALEPHADRLFQVLFEEIRLSAEAAAQQPEGSRSKFYQRGFTAIRTLFPGSGYAGDLSLVFSQLATKAGGNINIAIPGGRADIGLAGFANIKKSADKLGVIAQGEGNVNAVLNGDFNVNQSRVFTMGGGDIAVWSSQGSIDAGKGAKSSISAPAPQSFLDEQGNVVTIFPPVVSGSGIQAINPEDQSRRQGNVYLAAPFGIIDAGEAGISGGRVIVAATAIIGASNITASGGAVGVPTAVAAPVVPAGADSAAAGAAKSAGKPADGDEAEAQQKAEARKKIDVQSVTADLVGFGSCSVQDVRDAKAGCGGSS